MTMTTAVLGEVNDVASLEAVLRELEAKNIASVISVGNTSSACFLKIRAYDPRAVILRGCDDHDETLPYRHSLGPDLFVHATPENPLRGVLRLRRGDSELEPIFGAFERFLFCAHHDSLDAGTTAVAPLLIAALDPSLPEFDVNCIDYGLEGLDRYGGWAPSRIGSSFKANGRKAIINVGAVRDGSFVTLHDDTVTWTNLHALRR